MNDDKLPEVSLKVNTLQSHVDDIRGKLQQVHNDLPRMKSEMQGVLSALSSHRDLVQTMGVEIGKLKALLATVRDEHARSVASAQQSVLGVVDEKHKSVQDMAASFKALKDKVAGFDAALESIALDAKNAYLKSNVNEMTTQLHQKKLENVQLQLKQKELIQ